MPKALGPLILSNQRAALSDERTRLVDYPHFAVERRMDST